VLLLDEFDALAKRRDDPTDIGELKRIVNVLLLEIERWPSHGLLVAATNHPEILDRAVERRFGRVITMPLPSADVRREMIRRIFARGQGLADSVHAEAVMEYTVALTEGCSGSAVTRLLGDAMRESLLTDGLSPADALLSALRSTSAGGLIAGHNASRAGRGAARAAAAVVARTLVGERGLPYREVASLLGVSHMTVARAARGVPRLGADDGRGPGRAPENGSRSPKPHKALKAKVNAKAGAKAGSARASGARLKGDHV
jgi:hypothetical protein